MADERYDVIVIGTGAGGGTLAHRLAGTGKRILLLERGGWLPRERDNWDSTAVFVEGKYRAPEFWLDRHGHEFPPEVNYYVGGNTKFYGAALFRLRPAGLRRAAPLRRALPRMAGRVRRVRAVLHPGRAPVPGARPARRGPDRGPDLAAVPPPAGAARAPDPAAVRRSGEAGACTRSTCRSASTSCRTGPGWRPGRATASAATGSTASPAWSGRSPTRRWCASSRRWRTRTSR